MEAPQLTAQLGPLLAGNVGLYFVCYRLSRLGWNVMPTARNARGVDALIYSQDGKRTHTVQVKALSKRAPVPLGRHLDNLIADFFIVCQNVASDTPTCFVLTSEEVTAGAVCNVKDALQSFWLQPKQYEAALYREAWTRIGLG